MIINSKVKAIGNTNDFNKKKNIPICKVCFGAGCLHCQPLTKLSKVEPIKQKQKHYGKLDIIA